MSQLIMDQDHWNGIDALALKRSSKQLRLGRVITKTEERLKHRPKLMRFKGIELWMRNDGRAFTLAMVLVLVLVLVLAEL